VKFTNAVWPILAPPLKNSASQKKLVTGLEYGPNGFDTIGVGHPVNELLRRVLNGFVDECAVQASIGSVSVGTNHRPGGYGFFDCSLQRLRIRLFYYLRHDLSLAVSHPEHGRFTDWSPALVEFFMLVLILFKFAEVGFVGLNYTGKQFCYLIPAGGPDSVLLTFKIV